MLKFAWRNLINRPVRTILSVLGLSVAIAGMVGLFAISGGIQYLVNKTFEKIPGLLVQQQGAPIPIFSSLPSAWQAEIEAIARQLRGRLTGNIFLRHVTINTDDFKTVSST